MADPNLVHHENRCPTCGRTFVLEYLKLTGQARQTWSLPTCDTHDECFRRYMPPSDFRPDRED